ncbi:SMI1/KNR4 family protein [Sorangium sp. So ce118]
MRERLDGIAAKLTAVRARELSCFGSDAHRFALRPPATEAEVAAFEAARRVRLPEHYRAFLLHAGHGGAGPYYGLMTLAQWDHARHEAKDSSSAPVLRDELSYPRTLFAFQRKRKPVHEPTSLSSQRRPQGTCRITGVFNAKQTPSGGTGHELA